MQFNSFEFLIFFPIVVAVYFIIPKKARCLWLLVSSYYFYMSWNPKYAVLIALSTGVTYASGLAIHHYREKNRLPTMKACVAVCLIVNLGILALFKYANFALANLNMALSRLGVRTVDRRVDLLLPVGISFYTFQALSYTIDVYRDRIRPERNLLRYALFVSFFPQLVAGPIERSGNLLPQIDNVENIRVWQYDRIRDGFLLMLWGLFQKLVIADRASILVDRVINNYADYGFVEIAVAMVLFAFQIYCDFGGYTNIARGAAKVMGFSLMDNFRQPYLARSIRDFWQRWHISLTSWFTDYLYIPLGGNRRGKLRKYLNILIVFMVSGLWHGARWNFVAWGAIHALYRIAGDVRRDFARSGAKRAGGGGAPGRILETAATFALVDFAWIFFVSSGFRYALGVIRQALRAFKTTGLMSLGLNAADWGALLLAFAALFAVDAIHESGRSVRGIVDSHGAWLRWILGIGLLWATIMLGIYGEAYDTSTFIYFQF